MKLNNNKIYVLNSRSICICDHDKVTKEHSLDYEARSIDVVDEVYIGDIVINN
jgi:hypothetical protein